MSYGVMEGDITLYSIIYTSGVLFHVEWCIRLTALISFFHIP